MLQRAALTLAAAITLAQPAAGEPLAVRDQNPLIRGAYLPLPAPAAAAEGGWAYAASLEWSNTLNLETTAREQLLIDEETAELDLSAARSVGPWRLRAMLPVITRGGGVLDGFIDAWHGWFGLPRGDRPLRARNLYAIEYSRAGGPALNAPAGSALGDLALEGGRRLAGGERGELVAWLGLEAPTGSRTRLTGDGVLDLAGWLDGRARLGPRWELTARAGLTLAGRGTSLPGERPVRFGSLALDLRLTPALAAIVQLDGHSAVVRGSELHFLGRAIALTVGGRYRLESGSVFEAGVVEDLEVDHLPDVALHFGWRWPVVR